MKTTAGPSAGRKSLMDLETVTARSIAYVAVVVSFLLVSYFYITLSHRYILNGQKEWSIGDGDFDAIDFFKNIVDFFLDVEWGKGTLERCNK
jgi:hypothetical protein